MRDGETLANFITAYDRVSDDVMQIGWIIHSLVGNRFPLSDVSSLPFIGDDNVACSAASWRLYKSGLLDAEYKDIVPIWFGCLTTNYLHWARAEIVRRSRRRQVPRQRQDPRAGRSSCSAARRSRMTGGEMYEALQRGTVDGVATSWAGFEPYKLIEVTTTHLEVPLGGIPSMHFMSRRNSTRCRRTCRTCIKANSGEAASRSAGAYFASAAGRARAQVAESDKHKIAQLTPEQSESWKKNVAVVTDNWAKERPGGDKVIDAFSKYYGDALAGH